ncbi:glycogen debranching protein [Streptomyces chromofuscus]|uniref:Glycogen debranching protein n=1 Tax=Streptomyces chromofuscus TaxID=42881 RepID=A0A7M2TJK2_STRCW|nr:glycogen debranching protein [Streptomyces chromofuscus]
MSETTRLADRRAVSVGSRFYSVGTADGLYPAAGWHIRGEMGGMWTQSIKLLDGMWFGLNGAWLGGQAKAEKFTSGWGYTRIDYAATAGVSASRTNFAPDGLRAGLVGLTLTSERDSKVKLALDAHSELMNSYPWGWTQPDQLKFNLPDEGSYSGKTLVFREKGTPDVPHADAHDYAAVVGSRLTPETHQLGPDHRGPQSDPVICPATGEAPKRCDDSEAGKGTGGRMNYSVDLKAGTPTTLWFAVAGSEQGPKDARTQFDRALADPEQLLEQKIAERRAVAARTSVELPGDNLLQRSVEWSKQNLADSVQESHGLRLRLVDEGRQYPAPTGELASARWLGAGWPDYPWLFGTDGEYTAFASVAMGQFDDIMAHLRSLKDVSELVNEGSGKVIHEMTPDGSVYYGANDDPGNTDETAKFPSAVALLWRWTGDDAFRDEMYDFAVRNMRFIYRTLDKDGDGWPEGTGNVERSGMGAEKLDNAVYTARGLRDLADMAHSKHDSTTASWATKRAEKLEQRFERTWWAGGDTDQYGDSLQDTDNSPMLQRHWIGVTPMDAELVRPGRPTVPLASSEHGRLALAKRQESCYSGEFGLYHTGTGPTSAEGGNKGPSCDSTVSAVQSERAIYSLNTAIMAVAEGNYGRLGHHEQQRYTTANARIQLDPSVWEMPGAMPEIAPSPDAPANIERPLTERSMALQAWGAYGVLWPVVHQQLGVSPDLGRNRVSVVSQVPTGQERIAGSNIRLGKGSVDVRARHVSKTFTTEVTRHLEADLSIGHVVPPGSEIDSVTLDGHPVQYRTFTTARGQQVIVSAPSGEGRTTLVVTLK